MCQNYGRRCYFFFAEIMSEIVVLTINTVHALMCFDIKSTSGVAYFSYLFSSFLVISFFFFILFIPFQKYY